MLEPPDSRDWIAVTPEALPADLAARWAATPGAGAVVTFLGVVRERSEGRTGVDAITYEAYTEQAVPRLEAVAREARRAWPGVERVALLHRVGRLALSEASVAVVVSSPHRHDAFEAARYCIDTVKESVPIWKQEHGASGSGWAAAAQPVRSVTPAAARGCAGRVEAAVAFLLLALALIVVGVTAVVVRNRRPTGMDASIREFGESLDAIAPPAVLARERREPRQE